MSSILISGAGGFIGSHLTDALLDRGDKVLALDLSRKLPPNLRDAGRRAGFQYLFCDVKSQASVRRAFANRPDAVIHAAASVGVESYLKTPMSTIESSVIGTRTILRAAMKTNTRLVYLSSSEVFGRNPAVPWSETSDLVLGNPAVTRWSYSASKGVCEHLINAARVQYGLPTAIVRPFNIYGPRQRPAFIIPITVHRLLNGLPPLIYGDGNQTRCFTHVHDLIEGILRCLDRDAATGETFNLGNPREWSIRDAVRLVSEAVGSSLEPVYEDPRAAFGPGFEEIQRRSLDPSKAIRLLEWQPRIGLSAGIEDMLRWARAHPEWLRGSGGVDSALRAI